MTVPVDMPRHVSILRWSALGVIVIGELILIMGPLLSTPFGWLTRQSSDWWGAAGQWAGALGSFAAVVIALVIARRGARDSARIAEQGAREVEARERRRQRATAMLVRGEFGLFQGTDQVVVINDSPSPVVEVQIKEVKGNRLVPIVPPYGRWPVWAVLPPGKSVLIKPMFGLAEDGVFYGAAMKPSHTDYTVVIEFSDVEGYRWRREGDGLPELVE